MKLTERQLNDLWQQDAAQTGARHGDCLPEELLLRAGLNDLTNSERQQIADHLVLCADCSEAYRIARAVDDWAKATTNTFSAKPLQTTHPAEKNWLSFLDFSWLNPLQASLATALIVAAAVGVWAIKLQFENKTLLSQLRQQQESNNLAAAEQARQLQQQTEQLLASNQSLTTDNERLKEELDALVKPQLEAPIIDVDPANTTRGNATPATRVEVPDAAAFFTLILHLSKEPHSSTLLAELRDLQQNKVIWSNQVRKGAAPNLTLLLARRNIPAGRYRVQLSAVSQKRKTPLDQYELEVIYQAASTGQSKSGEIK